MHHLIKQSSALVTFSTCLTLCAVTTVAEVPDAVQSALDACKAIGISDEDRTSTLTSAGWVELALDERDELAIAFAAPYAIIDGASTRTTTVDELSWAYNRALHDMREKVQIDSSQGATLVWLRTDSDTHSDFMMLNLVGNDFATCDIASGAPLAAEDILAATGWQGNTRGEYFGADEWIVLNSPDHLPGVLIVPNPTIFSQFGVTETPSLLSTPIARNR